MEDRSSDDASLEDRLLDDILLRRAQGHAIDPEAELAHLDPSAQARIRARLAELSDGPRATVLPAGARLGEFELMAELGRGAMGVVWRAWQPVLRRHVAIKVLPRLAALDPRRVERFQREAKALAALRHPGIVPVLSAGQQDGAFWFAMDLVDGASLAALLAGVEQRHPAQRTVAELFEPHRIVGPDRTPSYLAWVCATLADAADAVAHAHHQGVLHRDLKPSNLMVTRDGRIRIIDFGLARDLTDESESLTQSTDLVGSLAYMAPEQLQKQPAEPSPLADIWSLGVVLYEALAGRRPHVDDDRRVLIAKIAHMPVPPLQRWHPRLPRDLITICHKALEQEPERRYASAAAFAADLRAFLDLRPITASAPSWPRRLVLAARRHPRARLAVAAGLVSSLVFSGATAWGAMRHEREVLDAVGLIRSAIAAERFGEAETRLRRLEGLAPLHPGTSTLAGEILNGLREQAVRSAEDLAVKVRRLREERTQSAERLRDFEARSAMQHVSVSEEHGHAREVTRDRGLAAELQQQEIGLRVIARNATALVSDSSSGLGARLAKALMAGLGTTGSMAPLVTVDVSRPPAASVFLFRYLPRHTIRDSEFSFRAVPVPCRPDGTPHIEPFGNDFRPGDLAWTVTDPGGTNLRIGDLILARDGRPLGEELWVRRAIENSAAARAGVRPFAQRLAIGETVADRWATLRLLTMDEARQYECSVRQDGETVRWETIGAPDVLDKLGVELGRPDELLASTPRPVDLQFDVLRDGKLISVRVAAGPPGIGITPTIYPLILADEARVPDDTGQLRLPPGEYLAVARSPGRPLLRSLLDANIGGALSVSLEAPDVRPDAPVVWVPDGVVTRSHDTASFPARWLPPVERVAGFWISPVEVTWAEWQAFLSDATIADAIEAHHEQTGRWIRHPRDRNGTEAKVLQQRGLARAAIKDISFEDVAAWLEWRNAQQAATGSLFRVRLPTAAEWCLAAGNSSQRVYPFGNDWQASLVNGKLTFGDREIRMPVATQLGDESPYGLYDMAGNVDEWVADDPAPNFRVVKGGSNAHMHRDACRILAEASEATSVPFRAGFRLVWFRL